MIDDYSLLIIGWSKIPKVLILVSILLELELELVLANGINSSIDSNNDSTKQFLSLSITVLA
jgi:hypothetical protein